MCDKVLLNYLNKVGNKDKRQKAKEKKNLTIEGWSFSVSKAESHREKRGDRVKWRMGEGEKREKRSGD